MVKKKRKARIIKGHHVLLVSLGAMLFFGLFFQVIQNFDLTHAATTITCPTGTSSSALQMVPCTVPTPTQTPSPTKPPVVVAIPPVKGSVCAPDTIVGNNTCTCSGYEETDQICVDTNCRKDGGTDLSGERVRTQQGAETNLGIYTCLFLNSKPAPAGLKCQTMCNSKPIIYLYPTKTTDVAVSVQMDGHVTVSDPLYPAGGWKHIEAHPDGTLVYNNKTYRELYYESETVQVTPPKEGFVISADQLAPKLSEITRSLGLTAFESSEFVDYWVTRLQSTHAPFFFFTIFDQKSKDIVDRVIASPKPDTTIAFLAYFKPLQKNEEVQPLMIPTPPERKGFTLVEWGGSLDMN